MTKLSARYHVATAQDLVFASIRMVDEITIEGIRFMSARNAAAIVGISPDYLTRWCREGLVTARHLSSGIWFVNLQSVQHHLAEREARKALWRAQLSQRLKKERALATS